MEVATDEISSFFC